MKRASRQIIALALLALIVGGGVFVFAKLDPVEEGSSVRYVPTSTPSIASWKTFSFDEGKVSFEFPASWEGISFDPLNYAVEGGFGGSLYGLSSPTGIGFSLSADKKGSTRGPYLATEVPSKFSIDWTAEELRKLLPSNGNPLVIEKLSSRALLSVSDLSGEGAESMDVYLYGAFSDEYPVLVASVPTSEEMMQHRLAVEEIAAQALMGEPAYVGHVARQAIAKDWVTNGFPASIQKKINIAQHMIESVKSL